MTMDNLNDLYVEELLQLHSAERTLMELLPELEDASSSTLLKQALQDEVDSTNERRQHVERIMESYGVRTPLMRMRSIEALVEEIRELIGREIDPNVRDAALVGFIQRFLHQEMAGYGTARAYAQELGDEQGVELLSKCFEDEERVDQALSRIAEDEINPRAKRGSSVERPRR